MSWLEIVGAIALWCAGGYALLAGSYIAGLFMARDYELGALAVGAQFALFTGAIYVGATMLYFIVT